MDDADVLRELRRLTQERWDPPDPETEPELADYQEYLRTRLWKRIRERVRARDHDRCVRCGGPGSQVHHRSYDPDVLRGLNDAMLATLCDGCHEVVERDDAGWKRDPRAKEAVLFDLAYGVDLPPPSLDKRGEIVRPEVWRRATAVQKRIWWRLAADLRDRTQIRRRLARPDSGIKRRYPLTARVARLDRTGDDPAWIELEEVRFQAIGHPTPCWIVGRFASPWDFAWIDIDLGEHPRSASTRVLSGSWPFRIKAHPARLTLPATATARLRAPGSQILLAEARFTLACV